MRLLTIALFFVLSLNSCREDDINDTIKECKNINEHLTSYQQKTIDLPAQSTEGGSVTFYSKDEKLAMVRAVYYGESARSDARYYFKDDNLISVIQEEYTYNRPIYVTEERAKADGDSTWYDDSKTVRTTNRYYFYDGDMVKWIDKDNKEIPESNKKYRLQAAILFKDAEKIKKMMAGVK